MTPCHNGSDVTISHWPPSRVDVLLHRLPTRLNMDETPKIGMSTGEFEGNVSPALVGAKMTSLVTYLEVPLRIHLEYSFSRGVYPFGTEILDQTYADGVMRLALVSHVANVYMRMWQSQPADTVKTLGAELQRIQYKLDSTKTCLENCNGRIPFSGDSFYFLRCFQCKVYTLFGRMQMPRQYSKRIYTLGA